MKPFPIGLPSSSRAFSLNPSCVHSCSQQRCPLLIFLFPHPLRPPSLPLSHPRSPVPLLPVFRWASAPLSSFPCNPFLLYQGRGSVSAPYRDAKLNLFFCCVWAPDISDRSLWIPSLVCNVFCRAVRIFFFVISDLIWIYWQNGLNISVSILTRIREWRPENQGSIFGQSMQTGLPFLVGTWYFLVYLCIKWLRCDFDCWPPTREKVRNALICTSTVPCVFISWYLITGTNSTYVPVSWLYWNSRVCIFSHHSGLVLLVEEYQLFGDKEFILVINQFDAQNFVSQWVLFHASTCFEYHVFIITSWWWAHMLETCRGIK